MKYFYDYYMKKDEMGRILRTNAVNVYSLYKPTSTVARPNLDRVQTLADEATFWRIWCLARRHLLYVVRISKVGIKQDSN